MRLVLASNNAKKLSEMQHLLAALPLQLVAQGSLGIAEAEEPHFTFIENALAKARHAAAASGAAALADDSGLCLDALGGAPGVQSAHFAGVVDSGDADREQRRRVQDAANNRALLQALKALESPDVSEARNAHPKPPQRHAAFVCALVAVRHAADPEPLVTSGRWLGELLAAPRGDAGFGYDPLMFIPALGKTVAELDAATKNAHSHRALAAAQMVALMRQAWRLA